MNRKIICLVLVLALLGALPAGYAESDQPITD